MKLKQLGMTTLGIVLLILVVLLLFGALPTWPHAASWGYGPSGILFVLLLVIVVLLVAGRL
jgi:hypothetical protein